MSNQVIHAFFANVVDKSAPDLKLFLEKLQPGQMLEALFDSIPGAFYFVKNLDGRFITCSLSFAKTMGAKSVEEVIGKNDHDFSAKFLADAFVKDDKRVIETGRSIINRVELVPNENSLDWLSTTKIPLYDKDGSIIGLAGITRKTSDSDELYQDHPEMQKIVAFIRQHYRDKITIADMADAAGISSSTVDRLFRKTFGITPAMYARKIRLNAACRKICETDEDLSTIAIACGFSDQTNMTRAFRSDLKITPNRYRQRFQDQNLKIA
ncbi:AraC family transcriptional regulator [Rubellicoccus peritrichatus]|uniref:AraC family transcriptional regulator n=1 Tax=Rubellicoccus peritrichatus TaxID=3080537 RepID=A0AAQ3L933_9BACT|nr:AraC family transcriptional regulator [Puniceicoccus sp. CR14]WOO40194.1 AraC family transcriptional regulator [Puniceicoccus sp. CR14]